MWSAGTFWGRGGFRQAAGGRLLALRWCESSFLRQDGDESEGERKLLTSGQGEQRAGQKHFPATFGVAPHGPEEKRQPHLERATIVQGEGGRPRSERPEKGGEQPDGGPGVRRATGGGRGKLKDGDEAQPEESTVADQERLGGGPNEIRRQQQELEGIEMNAAPRLGAFLGIVVARANRNSVAAVSERPKRLVEVCEVPCPSGAQLVVAMETPGRGGDDAQEINNEESGAGEFGGKLVGPQHRQHPRVESRESSVKSRKHALVESVAVDSWFSALGPQ